MRVYAILLLFIYKISAKDAEVFNVGTVLFSPDELKKDDWRVTDVGLLRARNYFQYVLPHPFLVDPSNEHFADFILDYFTNAVEIVKREVTDSVSTDILTTAIFDAIGGYMKAYVLPVTKYGYYGGTVSKDDAQKLFQFYDDIKAYLKTEGSGWKSFNGKFQKPLKIIATVPRDYVRITRESCDQLAFYEESASGFTIPLPSINFDSQSPVMFVPLKDYPLICLHSPGSANTLLNYYHAAKNCLKTRSPDDAAEFDNRLKTWLTDDVIAHLDDDGQLYYALGGILTLATDQTNTLFSSPISSRKSYIGINFGTKKIMILAVILLLEVVWCIPALFYMLYRRRKKDKESSDMFLFVNPNKDKDDQFLSSSGIQTSQTRSIMTTSSDENTCMSVKKFQKKYFRIEDTRQCQNPSSQNMESQTSAYVVSKCSKGTSNQSCFSSKQLSTNSYNVENEHPVTKPMRSALKNTSAPIFDVKSSHFAKPRMFESYNNVKNKENPSQNECSRYFAERRLPLQGDAIQMKNPKSKKSKENVLSKSIDSANNNCQSSDEHAVIQIESNQNMGRERNSYKRLRNQQSFNDTFDLCKSSVDTLTQGKSNTNSTIFSQSKDTMNISIKNSEEEVAFCEPGNNTMNIKTTEDKTVSFKCHEKTNMRESKENTLREHRSHDTRQSHANAVVLRASNDDARTQQKLIQSVYDDNVINRGNYVTTALRQSFENEKKSDEHNNALTLIENLDQKAKILQKSTNELMQLMDERIGACGNVICDCACCLSQNNDKSYTEIQRLKTCATVTLISEDNFSGNSVHSMNTVCSENQDNDNNHATNASRPLTDKSVPSTNQTKSGKKSRTSSLNPILKSLEFNTTDTESSAKDGIKDLSTKNADRRDVKCDPKYENKNLTKKQQKKVDKKAEKIVEEKVEMSKRNYGFKVSGNKKALIEVKIEKPHATISVGIARGNPKIPKTSRIPTRTITDDLVRFSDRVQVFQRRPLEAPIGSKIPLPVKKTTDDIVIRHSRNKAVTPDPRLNVTL